MHLSLLAVSLLPTLLVATTIDITVGTGGLAFKPDTVTAAAGDKLNFLFYPPEHSVAQSSFEKPCVPLSGGSAAIYSGVILVDSGPGHQTFQVLVNNTDPLWLYCSVSGHCNAGMAMVVNPPSSGHSLSSYVSAAQSASGSSPASVAGGVFIDAAAASASASGSASHSASASASASSTSASGSPSTTTPASTSSNGGVSGGSVSSSTGNSAAVGSTGDGSGFHAFVGAGVVAVLGVVGGMMFY